MQRAFYLPFSLQESDRPHSNTQSVAALEGSQPRQDAKPQYTQQTPYPMHLYMLCRMPAQIQYNIMNVQAWVDALFRQCPDRMPVSSSLLFCPPSQTHVECSCSPALPDRLHRPSLARRSARPIFVLPGRTQVPPVLRFPFFCSPLMMVALRIPMYSGRHRLGGQS